jgi:DNA-binding transcriptional LysR family regulator
MRSVSVHPRLAVTTAEAAVDAASAGLGVTRVLSYQAAAAIAEGRLQPILERFEPPEAPVTLVHTDGRSPRPKVRDFVALAAGRLRPVLGR